MGGYSLGGADMLRRAMSKKKFEEMAKHRQLFKEGCAKKEIDEATAMRVFDTMEKFAAYGFNKSHAAAYAVVTIQTAWLKAHYPVDFYSALITYEVGGEDAKIEMYFDEARDEGITCLQPDINTSSVFFEPIDDQRIRFGLCSIKGVGVAAVEALLKEREENGPFKSLQEMVTRLDKKVMNARTVECLIKCGCFDKLASHNRPSLLAALPKIMELAGAAKIEVDSSQCSLFDMMEDATPSSMIAEVPIPRQPDWTDKQRFDIEKELAGFYLSGHPLERFVADFAAFSTCPASEIQQMRKGNDIEWVGLIKRMVPRTDKNGRMFAFVECEDMSDPMELTFFSDAFEKHRGILKEGEVIWVRGRIDEWKDNKKILVNDAKTIDAVRAEKIKALEITMPVRNVTEANLQRLKELAAINKGRRKLWVVLRDGNDEARFEANGGVGITPTTALIRELQDTPWIKGVRFITKNIANGNDNGAPGNPWD
jgi:DNA polymerase-3 subunit alpha